MRFGCGFSARHVAEGQVNVVTRGKKQAIGNRELTNREQGRGG